MRWTSALVIVALSVSHLARAQDGAIEQNAANEAFRQGDAAFDHGDFQAALDAYRRSMALVASPNSRLLVARSLARLGRWSEALGEFQTTVNEAAQRAERDPRFAKTHDVAEEEAARAREHVGFIHIDSNRFPRDAHVSVDGHALPSASWDLDLPHDPGPMTVVIESVDHQVTKLAETVVPKTTLTIPRTPIVLDLEPNRAPPPTKHSAGPWTAIGVTTLIVGGVTLGVSGALAIVTQNEFDAKKTQCAAGCTDADVSSGRALSYATYATLGAGLVIVTVGVLMVALAPRSARHVAMLGRWTF